MTSPSFNNRLFLGLETNEVALKPPLPPKKPPFRAPKVRRSAVLKHFSDEAEKLETFPLHILSDIDQTVVIGTFGAGRFVFFFCVCEKTRGFFDFGGIVGGQQFMCVTVRKTPEKTYGQIYEETIGMVFLPNVQLSFFEQKNRTRTNDVSIGGIPHPRCQ